MRSLWMGVLMLLCGCDSVHIRTAFYSPVCIKPYKQYEYHTCHNIDFMVEGIKYTIPKGFKTDLASIPRFAWPIMSPAHSSLIRPAIVHDWFYRAYCEFDRKSTDLVFYHMLRNDGVGFIRARFMYYAVRMWGWRFYQHNEDDCE
jgi:hypothetical protein